MKKVYALDFKRVHPAGDDGIGRCDGHFVILQMGRKQLL